jgi:hypothetical protein
MEPVRRADRKCSPCSAVAAPTKRVRVIAWRPNAPVAVVGAAPESKMATNKAGL